MDLLRDNLDLDYYVAKFDHSWNMRGLLSLKVLRATFSATRGHSGLSASKTKTNALN